MMNDEQYDMGAYLASAEEIARKKLAMYSELLNNISSFKSDFMSEQEHQQIAPQPAHQTDVNVPKEFMKLPSAASSGQVRHNNTNSRK